jgi:hypothetical protein
MKTLVTVLGAALLGLLTITPITTVGGEYQGTAKLGYVYTDIEGNQGINQSTFNLYDGAALSLEKFLYRFDDGTRFTANLKNITMNNRNLAVGLGKPGLYGLDLRHNKYRRSYSFDGDKYTRRLSSNGQAWVKPNKYVKLFGGYGRIEQQGETVDIFGIDTIRDTNPVDYGRNFYNFGGQAEHRGGVVRAEYSGSKYTDDLDNLNDRKTKRFRVRASSPVPRYTNLTVGGGFQRYERIVTNRTDTLIANTGWASARLYYGQGWSAKYSFMLDRTRRAGDITATDNLINAVYLGKLWPTRGGVTVGYSHRSNDDIFDEVTSNGYYLDGWFNATPKLSFKAGYGMESSEVVEGRTLTGNADFMRWRISGKYKLPQGYVRVKYDTRESENSDIGSKATFGRISGDCGLELPVYGRLQAAYAYLDGEYENTSGTFRFTQHVLSGDVFTREYEHVVLGFGGTYYRTKEDLDIESFTVRLSGVYEFYQSFKLEVLYSAYNFDDFNDPSPNYQAYYTANVLQINLLREL